MKIDFKNKNHLLIVLCVLLAILLITYIFIMSYNYFLIKEYDKKMYPNVYINDYNISDMSFTEISNKLNEIENSISKEKIILTTGKNDYTYTLNDLGIKINKDIMYKEIKNYHKSLTLSKRIKQIIIKKKKVFKYEIVYDENNIKNFITALKGKVDIEGHDGSLVMDANRNLQYTQAVASYSLNIDKTCEELLKFINDGIPSEKFQLIGELNEYKDSEDLKLIDTKVSTYSTRYNAYISRGRNLENALRSIDGVIVKSGEVFSYFKYAGPYEKKGYVYYDKVIGNGVCQIASTIYNTTLLGGLEIVERHQHQHQMTYVPGGLDATVVGNGNYSLLDFKFKNTYSYPIYISAYYGGGVATVEFWSNSNAKGGKEYNTISVPLGNMTYESYLQTLQNGQEVAKTFIAKSHYIPN